MAGPERRREVGRGERLLPGIWRLRLPLPWPGVPHGNAWAIAAGDGIVLVDTGIHGPGSLGHLERALAQVRLKLEHVRLVVCTHAHADHCGEATTIAERAGCEVWMHPRHEHMAAPLRDPEAALRQRLEVARQSGVPQAALDAYAEQRRDAAPTLAGLVVPDRDLVPGVVVETDLGPWTVHETPGHAPSHVCLHQAERRLLLSGDHLLGRVSIFFDVGWSRDPVGEFRTSLDVVERLDARLCLPGHGRSFADVQAHIDANRAQVAERLDAVRAALAEGPLSAFAAIPRVYGTALTPATAGWWLGEVVACLGHLELGGDVVRLPGEGGAGVERWAAA
jgi:glyoxylase-like metal-dependent hydrolase (beta-lactamase superfamily II)